ncbi:MAG: GNA1162 family protein [Desulfobulbaceae bacterium]
MLSHIKVLGISVRRAAVIVAVVIPLLAAAGCGAKKTETSYAREEVDLAYVARVAVLPFQNNTPDNFAALRIRDITTTQILALGLFDVVEKGVVDSVLQEMAIDQNRPIDSLLLKKLGNRLEVNAFVHGSVDDIVQVSQGAFSYPQVSLTLRLIDSETSMVLWQSSAHRTGYSLIDRLFDLDPQDSYEITIALIRDMLRTIPK